MQKSTVNGISIPIKVSFKDELRRIQYDCNSNARNAFTNLENKFRELFSIEENIAISLFYVDDEGDRITFSSSKEFFYGLSLCGKSSPFRIIIQETGEKNWREQSFARSRKWKKEAKWRRRNRPAPADGCAPVDGKHQLGRRFKCRLVSHVSCPPETSVAAGNSFTKVWRLRNTGLTSWAYGTVIRFVSLRNGDIMGAPMFVNIPDADKVNPGEEVDVSVPFTAPSLPGVYEGFWKLSCPDGQKFGPRLRVKIIVPSPEQEIADMFDEAH